MIFRRFICVLTMLTAASLAGGCGSGSTQAQRNAGDISPAAAFSGSGEATGEAALMAGQQGSGMLVENPESVNLVNGYIRVEELDAVFGPDEFLDDAEAEGPVEEAGLHYPPATGSDCANLPPGEPGYCAVCGCG